MRNMESRDITSMGDEGRTDLLFCEKGDEIRVLKSHRMIILGGKADTLNAALGLTHEWLWGQMAIGRRDDEYDIKMKVIWIQQRLSSSRVEFLCNRPRALRNQSGFSLIGAKDVARLDSWASELERSLEEMGHGPENFRHYGFGGALPAHLDYAGCLCREIETMIVNERNVLLQFFNRLSDVLFLLARIKQNSD